MTLTGKFISLEGLDGAGKSTHLTWLTSWLAEHDVDHIVTREPGGTPLGEKLRTLLLNESMHLETEALLMFAARREHLAKCIEPSLALGRWVISDRFTDATFAYQGGGRELGFDRLEILENWVQERGGKLLQPDLTLYFDVPLEISRQRMSQGRELDRFELEKDEFFERTRAAYLRRVAESGGRMIIIDASRPINVIQNELVRQLEAFLALSVA